MPKAQTAAPSPGISGTQLVIKMAEKQDLDPNVYASTVMKTCFSGETTPEQFTAFLMIAKEHKLNPITREIYAFAKGGRVSTIVSIDGWLKLINQHPEFNGMKFQDDIDDEGNLVAVTCMIFRKDRDHPTEVTEYLDECKMPTEPWNKWPARMLRHKATIQAARYAFGFAGIIDSDEASRMERMDDAIDGHAEEIPDAPRSPAKRILHNIEAKAEKTKKVDEPVAEEVVEGKKGEVDADTRSEDEQRAAEEEAVPAVEDIPGLKKGSEIITPDGEVISAEHQEFIDDMEKEEKGGKKE